MTPKIDSIDSALDHSPTGADRVSPSAVHEILSRRMLADGLPLVFDLERSQGSWAVDAATGERYLDFFSFFASLPVGFNHPAIRSPYWQHRLLESAIHKPSCSDSYTQDMASFVQTFGELAMPAGFRHVFFIEAGTLGVENALKAAFDWKTRKRLAAGLPAVDLRVLHFREAFHGRSGYTLSLTNTDPVKTEFFPKFDWPRVRNPKLRFPVDAAETRRVEGEERAALEEIGEAFRKYPGEIAAIIIEPIQGEGGDNHFRGEFLEALRRVADREDAMLVVDEVQAGFGLTGRMWAFEHAGVLPDMIAFGKKSQVCGFMANGRIDEVADNVFRVPSRINSTWGGNLADMVRCEAYLKIMAEEGLVENAARVGTALLAGLEEVGRGAAGKIDNIRGKGLMCAFDAATPGLRAEILTRTLEEKIILMPCGRKTIRIRPPLTLSADEAAAGCERIERALAKVAAP